MVCPPRAAVLGSRTRVDAYNRSITKPLTGEPDAGDPPVRFGGRGKVQSLVPTPIGLGTDFVTGPDPEHQVEPLRRNRRNRGKTPNSGPSPWLWCGFGVALVWPWCGFEVALRWLWCGFGVALYSGVYA